MSSSSKGDQAIDSKGDWRVSILRRELVRHATGLVQLAGKLEEAEDYPTETAVSFCKLIRCTSALVAAKLDSAPLEKLPYINAILRMMGEHLRFAERSRIEQTPWSMIQSTEAFLKQHTPEGCCFILRPQWSYNYSIRGPFVETLRAWFASLGDWMPLSELETALSDVAKSRIYCVSFPRVERMNVLMHVNWGHEVGHILASDWLQRRFADYWAKKEASIKGRIVRYYDDANLTPQEELLKTIYIDKYVSTAMKETMELTQSGLRELISDFVGAHLLGPASLACLGEYSARYDLDANPLRCGYYPPWRMRLRLIAEVLDADLVEKDVFAGNSECRPIILPYINFLHQVRELGASDKDKIEIGADIRTKEAYNLIEQLWPTVKAEVLITLPKGSQTPYHLKSHLHTINELALRLRDGITPNETGAWPDTTPALLADIWNAAWAYSRLRLSDDSNWVTPNNFDDLFRLVLKAMEVSYVHTTYGPELQMIASNEHTK